MVNESPTRADGYCDPLDVRVLFHIMQTAHPTVTSCAAVAQLARSTIHVRLDRLKALGLVSWEPDTIGTLRAAVRPVSLRRNHAR